MRLYSIGKPRNITTSNNSKFLIQFHGRLLFKKFRIKYAGGMLQWPQHLAAFMHTVVRVLV